MTNRSHDKGGQEPSPLEVARKLCGDKIAEAFGSKSPVLVDALPAMGKSHGVVKWSKETEKPLTVFTSRRDLYRQYQGWCEGEGLSVKLLPAFQEDCDTANGTHGKTWKERVDEKYQQGLGGVEIHKNAIDIWEERLPCQNGKECSFIVERDFDPADYRVLVGNYKQAYVSRYVDGRYVAIDEIPADAWMTKYGATRVYRAIGDYLRRSPEIPFKNTNTAIEAERGSEKWEQAVKFLEENWVSESRDGQGIVSGTAAHGDAPKMLYAYLTWRRLENEWSCASLPSGDTAVRTPNLDEIYILVRPDLSKAESVVALDGVPTVDKWRTLIGPELVILPVLTEQEKATYLRDGLGLRIIKTSDELKPYASGMYVTKRDDVALIEWVGSQADEKPSLISTSAALAKYEKFLKDRGGDLQALIDKKVHYNDFKGDNSLKQKRLGIVIGSNHIGDEHVEQWCAFEGISVKRKDGTRGMDQELGEGQGHWEGMLHNEVLQAVTRFGRDGGGATVYVHTGALPEWVECEMPRVHIRHWYKGMREVIEAIDELLSKGKESWKIKDVDPEVSITIQQVRTYHGTLAEFGYINKERVGNADVFTPLNVAKIGRWGHVTMEFEGDTRKSICPKV